MVITIKDETFGGKVLRELDLNFRTESVTVREIISERVLQEVESYNSKLPEYFNGLVEPSDAEKTLNGYKLHNNKKLIDGEKQVYTALDAFQKNGFFVLIDNTQAETLEQQVQLKFDTSISFVKLTPLVGG
jgi:tRNA splicing ligase